MCFLLHTLNLWKAAALVPAQQHLCCSTSQPWLGTGKADARCTSAGNRTSGSHTCSPLEPELQPKPSARRALPLPTHLCSSSWESKAASPVWHICPHIPLSRCAQLFLTLKRDAPVPPTENRYPSLSETVFVKAKVSVNYNFMDVLLLVWVH